MMAFGDCQECVEAIATELFRSAPMDKWEILELRAMRPSEDRIVFTTICRVDGKARHVETSLEMSEWLDELAQLASSPDKGLYTRLALDVTPEGDFHARYGYNAIVEDDIDKMALNKLPGDFWP